MIIVNGQECYRFSDPEIVDLGYTPGTLTNYIYNKKPSLRVDAERLDDEWVITKTGLIQLRRRKGLPTSDLSQGEPQWKPPEEIPPEESELPKNTMAKQIPVNKARTNEGVLYLETPGDVEIYEILKRAASLSGKRVGDMTMIAVREYVQKHIEPLMGDLEVLEEKKKALISRILS